ncbi:hypothetical protein GQX74_003541 [Glossina fuscipes]|nr:hypothetical protein GQX74_003541 [Glossina fuscipes]
MIYACSECRTVGTLTELTLVMLITIMTIPTIPNLHSNNDSGSSKSSSESSSSSSSSSSSKNRLLYIISVENVAAFPYQKILLLTLLDNCNKSSNICTYTDAPHITTAITALQRNSRSKINIRTSNNQQPCVSERLRQENAYHPGNEMTIAVTKSNNSNNNNKKQKQKQKQQQQQQQQQQ